MAADVTGLAARRRAWGEIGAEMCGVIWQYPLPRPNAPGFRASRNGGSRGELQADLRRFQT